MRALANPAKKFGGNISNFTDQFLMPSFRTAGPVANLSLDPIPCLPCPSEARRRCPRMAVQMRKGRKIKCPQKEVQAGIRVLEVWFWESCRAHTQIRRRVPQEVRPGARGTHLLTDLQYPLSPMLKLLPITSIRRDHGLERYKGKITK